MYTLMNVGLRQCVIGLNVAGIAAVERNMSETVNNHAIHQIHCLQTGKTY